MFHIFPIQLSKAKLREKNELYRYFLSNVVQCDINMFFRKEDIFLSIIGCKSMD